MYYKIILLNIRAKYELIWTYFIAKNYKFK